MRRQVADYRDHHHPGGRDSHHHGGGVHHHHGGLGGPSGQMGQSGPLGISGSSGSGTNAGVGGNSSSSSSTSQLHHHHHHHHHQQPPHQHHSQHQHPSHYNHHHHHHPRTTSSHFHHHGPPPPPPRPSMQSHHHHTPPLSHQAPPPIMHRSSNSSSSSSSSSSVSQLQHHTLTSQYRSNSGTGVGNQINSLNSSSGVINGANRNRERERDRNRERHPSDRDIRSDRDAIRDRERERDRDRDRERERERDRDRERVRDRLDRNDRERERSMSGHGSSIASSSGITGPNNLSSCLTNNSIPPPLSASSSPSHQSVPSSLERRKRLLACVDGPADDNSNPGGIVGNNIGSANPTTAPISVTTSNATQISRLTLPSSPLNNNHTYNISASSSITHNGIASETLYNSPSAKFQSHNSYDHHSVSNQSLTNHHHHLPHHHHNHSTSSPASNYKTSSSNSLHQPPHPTKSSSTLSLNSPVFSGNNNINNSTSNSSKTAVISNDLRRLSTSSLSKSTLLSTNLRDSIHPQQPTTIVNATSIPSNLTHAAVSNVSIDKAKKTSSSLLPNSIYNKAGPGQKSSTLTGYTQILTKGDYSKMIDIDSQSINTDINDPRLGKIQMTLLASGDDITTAFTKINSSFEDNFTVESVKVTSSELTQRRIKMKESTASLADSTTHRSDDQSSSEVSSSSDADSTKIISSRISAISSKPVMNLPLPKFACITLTTETITTKKPTPDRELTTVSSSNKLLLNKTPLSSLSSNRQPLTAPATLASFSTNQRSTTVTPLVDYSKFNIRKKSSPSPSINLQDNQNSIQNCIAPTTASISSDDEKISPNTIESDVNNPIDQIGEEYSIEKETETYTNTIVKQEQSRSLTSDSSESSSESDLEIDRESEHEHILESEPAPEPIRIKTPEMKLEPKKKSDISPPIRDPVITNSLTPKVTSHSESLKSKPIPTPHKSVIVSKERSNEQKKPLEAPPSKLSPKPKETPKLEKPKEKSSPVIQTSINSTKIPKIPKNPETLNKPSNELTKKRFELKKSRKKFEMKLKERMQAKEKEKFKVKNIKTSTSEKSATKVKNSSNRGTKNRVKKNGTKTRDKNKQRKSSFFLSDDEPIYMSMYDKVKARSSAIKQQQPPVPTTSATPSLTPTLPTKDGPAKRGPKQKKKTKSFKSKSQIEGTDSDSNSDSDSDSSKSKSNDHLDDGDDEEEEEEEIVVRRPPSPVKRKPKVLAKKRPTKAPTRRITVKDFELPPKTEQPRPSSSSSSTSSSSSSSSASSSSSSSSSSSEDEDEDAVLMAKVAETAGRIGNEMDVIEAANSPQLSPPPSPVLMDKAFILNCNEDFKPSVIENDMLATSSGSWNTMVSQPLFINLPAHQSTSHHGGSNLTSPRKSTTSDLVMSSPVVCTKPATPECSPVSNKLSTITNEMPTIDSRCETEQAISTLLMEMDTEEENKPTISMISPSSVDKPATPTGLELSSPSSSSSSSSSASSSDESVEGNMTFSFDKSPSISPRVRTPPISEIIQTIVDLPEHEKSSKKEFKEKHEHFTGNKSPKKPQDKVEEKVDDKLAEVKIMSKKSHESQDVGHEKKCTKLIEKLPIKIPEESPEKLLVNPSTISPDKSTTELEKSPNKELEKPSNKEMNQMTKKTSQKSIDIDSKEIKCIDKELERPTNKNQVDIINEKTLDKVIDKSQADKHIQQEKVVSVREKASPKEKIHKEKSPREKASIKEKISPQQAATPSPTPRQQRTHRASTSTVQSPANSAKSQAFDVFEFRDSDEDENSAKPSQSPSISSKSLTPPIDTSSHQTVINPQQVSVKEGHPELKQTEPGIKSSPCSSISPKDSSIHSKPMDTVQRSSPGVIITSKEQSLTTEDSPMKISPRTPLPLKIMSDIQDTPKPFGSASQMTPPFLGSTSDEKEDRNRNSATSAVTCIVSKETCSSNLLQIAPQVQLIDEPTVQMDSASIDDSPIEPSQQKNREYITELNQDGKLSLTIRKASNQTRELVDIKNPPKSIQIDSQPADITDLSHSSTTSKSDSTMATTSTKIPLTSINTSVSSHQMTSSTHSVTTTTIKTQPEVKQAAVASSSTANSVKPTRRSARLMQSATKEKKEPLNSDNEQASNPASNMTQTTVQQDPQALGNISLTENLPPASEIVTKEPTQSSTNLGEALKESQPSAVPEQPPADIPPAPTIKTRRNARNKHAKQQIQLQQQQQAAIVDDSSTNGPTQQIAPAKSLSEQEQLIPQNQSAPKADTRPAGPSSNVGPRPAKRPKRLTRLAAKTFGINENFQENQQESTSENHPNQQVKLQTDQQPLPAPSSLQPAHIQTQPTPSQHDQSQQSHSQINPTDHADKSKVINNNNFIPNQVISTTNDENISLRGNGGCSVIATPPVREPTPISARTPVLQEALDKSITIVPSDLPPRKRLGWFWSQKQLLEQHYLVVWTSRIMLKDSFAAVQMHFISGNNKMPSWSYGAMLDENGVPSPIHINQRMRLEPLELEGVQNKMSNNDEHCVLLAVPVGRDQAEFLKQSTSLRVGFIDYLTSKQAAGIVYVCQPGETQPSYIIHIFPSCTFVTDHFLRSEPSLLSVIQNIDNLIVVITTA